MSNWETLRSGVLGKKRNGEICVEGVRELGMYGCRKEAEADLRIPCELYIVAAHISRPVMQKKD